MYDYVIQLGFERKTEERIETIKKYLKEKKVKDKERKWLPHITIDLYHCKKEQEFIEKVDKVAKDIQPIWLQLKNLNDFEKETLYIEPYNKNQLLEIKEKFNQVLDEYRFEKRKALTYKPHITLCTNDNIEQAYTLANQKFNPFEGMVKYLWIYNEKQERIQQYELQQ